MTSTSIHAEEPEMPAARQPLVEVIPGTDRTASESLHCQESSHTHIGTRKWNLEHVRPGESSSSRETEDVT